MTTFFEVVRSVFTLVAAVQGLEREVDRLKEVVPEHERRLIRVEGREEVLVERAKRAIVEVAAGVHGDLLERIVRLEVAVGIGGARRLGDGGG